MQGAGAATPAIPTGQRNPLLDAVAEQHAIPAAAKTDQPAAIPTGQSNPLLAAVAEQHALPADTKQDLATPPAAQESGSVVSRLTEADLQERTHEAAQPAGVQSGWLTAWFRKGAAAQAPADGGEAAQPSAGAGFVSRLGHSLTTSFGRGQGSNAPATKPLADLAAVRCIPFSS